MKNWTPSEVADYIDREVQKLISTKAPTTLLFRYRDGGTQAFIRMFDSIDRERYDLPLEDAGEFAMAVEMLRENKINVPLPNRKQSNSTAQLPMDVLRELLDKFRDGPVDSRWPEIDCLKHDQQLWHQLNNDLNEAHSTLISKNWKAATVVSASVMEALLSWWLSSINAKTADKLSALIDEAEKQKLFEPIGTHKFDASEAVSRKGAAMCAANYRNLIHADKATRLGQSCSRASAWQTFGATLTSAEAIGRKVT